MRGMKKRVRLDGGRRNAGGREAKEEGRKVFGRMDEVTMKVSMAETAL